MIKPLAALIALALSAGGCTYTVAARSDRGGELVVEDQPPQRVRAGSNDIDVPITWSNPSWQLFADEDALAAGSPPLAEGVFERARVAPLPATSLCGTSACLGPGCAGVGFCLANPGAAIACLAPVNPGLLVFGFNALVTSLDNPSWSTLPAMAVCTLCGLAPLALLPLVLRVPEETELVEPSAGERGGVGSSVSSAEQRY